jgi:Dihydrodipicolinate synthase/N-acetylneuraminate lyase
MTKISGIFAASMSVINSDLSLNVEKTIEHAERLIDQGCHGTALFGSTGQAQLVPIFEKIELLNKLSDSKYKNKHIIGTGLNSLNETINFLKISVSLNLKKFLIMPPAYYKYEDGDVINFYSKIVEAVPESKLFFIILKSYVDINLVLNVLRNL